ncbi:non-heme iron oxygenase ferredoxin subunit [Paraburkholderia sp. ZP32-5]|uniref:non-heme iron oxygenase ferredoxin subunit n=1 Tax=Paraburkholderia sp. ZP32-5 TaxID=2883245 RepID=UPI001F1D0985|nr:non-heme iron oxygenase ferredoxin subunit [Paraburkholderia sp. ZP32-5]
MSVIPIIPADETRTAPPVDGWYAVGSPEELFGDNDCKGLVLEGVKVGVFRVDNDIFAIDDICTHGYALLSEGYLEGHEIECPLHGGLVDVRDGKACTAPIVRDTRAHQVRVEDGQIFIKLYG